MKKTLMALLRKLSLWGTFVYMLGLLVATGMLRYVGESWSVTNFALYLPRIGFALPIVLLLPLQVAMRQYRLLWTQLAAALWVLFPLMGLEVHPNLLSAGKPAGTIRLVSVNADSGYYGYDRVAATLLEQTPDVAIAQEAFGDDASDLAKRLNETLPYVHYSTQFVIASRFPISDATDPARVQVGNEIRSPRFMRYVLATPIGALTVYSIHPASPRPAFTVMAGNHRRNSFLSGRAFVGAGAAALAANANLRGAQVAAVLDMARLEKGPVVLAGDTNLPSLSPMLAKIISAFDDGFSQAGNGFGYTFHRKFPSMRIDRVFTSSQLRVVGIRAGCRGISDHFCVVADIAKR